MAALFLSNRVSVNSDAYPKKNASGNFEQIGNKTECALLELAYKFKIDYLKYRNDNVYRQNFK
jgi:P-type Ca2+ transporter type 2B